MAVFTEVTKEDVALFLKAYGLSAPEAVTGIAEGIENTNYKVQVGGTPYILTIYEARVDRDDLPYFLGLMDHAASADVPTARPIRTADGAYLSTIKGKAAALIEFMPGRPNMVPGPDDARRAGMCLAQFHQATHDFVPTRPNSMGMAMWQELAAKAGARFDELGQGVAAEIEKVIDDLAAHWPQSGEKATIHADLFPDNLLLNQGEPSGLIDFYFACTDFLAYDLAMSMNAYTLEDRKLDFANAEAVREGYSAVRPLGADDQASLPLFLCASALRIFLTRAVDKLFPPESAVYVGKDPLPWLRLVRHHHRAMMEQQ
ncbi:MAG: homoserine kinase [Pseudomonadota bacterium]